MSCRVCCLHPVQLVNDGAAEAQEKTVGSKRRALPASEEEREEGEGEEEEGGNPRRAPSGKRLKQVYEGGYTYNTVHEHALMLCATVYAT